MIGITRRGPAVFTRLFGQTFGEVAVQRRPADADRNQLQAERDASQVPAMFADLRMRLLRERNRNQSKDRDLAIRLASQAAKTALAIEPYAVQQQAAAVMASGGVAEMATGEGKTLSVAMAATALAASAQTVHVATANDYLAARDYEQFRPFYNYLGLSVGLCQANQTDNERRVAYGSEIVYGTADHFAFDHLRAVLRRRARMRMPLGGRARELSEKYTALQGFGPKRCAIIVDEIDHILIDEADTPLILSIPHEDAQAIPVTVYAAAQAVAQRLESGRDWLLDPQTCRVTLTDRGRVAVLHHQPEAPLARPWFEYVQRAIEAAAVLERDIDYVVREQKIQLVDQATGRISMGRQWQDGLHQAVEQEEDLQPTAEYAAAAQITRWRFFQLYRQIAGCSGTAWDCRQELRSLYGLETTRIPLRRPSALQLDPPHFSATREAKFAAVIADVQRIHETGRPLLIGTRTIQDSKQLAEKLQQLRYRFCLLNGSQSEDEARVIAQAGHRSAITVATDLAGRGTDIKLTEQTLALGGLHVILAEPRHSRRLDRQLIGRAGRQGQPGSAKIFVSAEDKLITQHAPSLGRVLLRRGPSSLRGRETLWRAVVRAAERSEARRATIRRLLAERDRRQDRFFSVADFSNR